MLKALQEEAAAAKAELAEIQRAAEQAQEDAAQTAEAEVEAAAVRRSRGGEVPHDPARRFSRARPRPCHTRARCCAATRPTRRPSSCAWTPRVTGLARRVGDRPPV